MYKYTGQSALSMLIIQIRSKTAPSVLLPRYLPMFNVFLLRKSSVLCLFVIFIIPYPPSPPHPLLRIQLPLCFGVRDSPSLQQQIVMCYYDREIYLCGCHTGNLVLQRACQFVGTPNCRRRTNLPMQGQAQVNSYCANHAHLAYPTP